MDEMPTFDDCRTIMNMTESMQVVLAEFVCLICEEFMTCGTIPICQKGHSICFACKKRCVICPVCRSDFANARNYTLENIASVIKFPCKNIEFGCHETVSLKAYNNHMLLCPYNYYNCPYEELINCIWTGTTEEIKAHLKCHKKVSAAYPNKNLNSCIAIIIFNQCYFKVLRKFCPVTKYVKWAVQYIGSPEKAEKFGFKIQFSRCKTHGFDLEVRSVCKPLSSQELFDSYHVNLHIDILKMSFVNMEHNLHIIHRL